MKEIGSYFELELNKTKEYYSDAIKLNSGRNALLYILKAYQPKKIFIPYYICNSVLEPIKKMEIEFEYYRINELFEPILPKIFKNNDFLLYVNYFGINYLLVKQLANKIKNLIIDNSQAFFYPPKDNITFYSPRKFFGIPDGAYLYSNKNINEELELALSFDKCVHLLKRYDLGGNEGYNDYKKVEESFSNESIKEMSKLTQEILSSINYKEIKSIREKNFLYLHKHLKSLNELKITTKNLKGPLKYPFLIKIEGIKQTLIKNKIYISTYWREVLDRVDKYSFEYNLVKFLLPLPIDQRYSFNDMDKIITKINEILKT